MNTVNFIGNAGNDPRVTTLESGDLVAQFTLATHEDYVDRSGQQQRKTQWHNIVAWGKTAEAVQRFVKVGSFVQIKGNAVNRSYKKEITVQVSAKKTIKHTIDVPITEYKAFVVTIL